MFVAVVHTRGAICHICAAPTAAELAVQLGEYVRENARYQLCPADAERVVDLLEAGRRQDAVDLYFAAVGLRWDREELMVQRTGLGVELEPGRPATSRPGDDPRRRAWKRGAVEGPTQ